MISSPMHSVWGQSLANEPQMQTRFTPALVRKFTEVEPLTCDLAYFEPAVPVAATISPRVPVAAFTANTDPAARYDLGSRWGSGRAWVYFSVPGELEAPKKSVYCLYVERLSLELPYGTALAIGVALADAPARGRS